MIALNQRRTRQIRGKCGFQGARPAHGNRLSTAVERTVILRNIAQMRRIRTVTRHHQRAGRIVAGGGVRHRSEPAHE